MHHGKKESRTRKKNKKKNKNYAIAAKQAVEMGFKNSFFVFFYKKTKNPESPNFRFKKIKKTLKIQILGL